MTKHLTIALFVATTLSAGCSARNIPGVYRVDVQQGNVVTQEMINQIRPGMDKARVRYYLGTPLITDVFRDDRWDYLYSMQKGGGPREQRRVTLFFEDGLLARIEGDVRPGAGEVAEPGPGRTAVAVPAQPESFFDRLLKRFGREDE